MATTAVRHEVSPEHVIGETLVRATGRGPGPTVPAERAARPTGAAARLRRPGRPTRWPAGSRPLRPRAPTRRRRRLVAPEAPATIEEAAAELRRGRAGVPERASARRRSGPRWRRLAGARTRSPNARCSRSGCTSSSPRATPSTSPWRTRLTGTSPATTSGAARAPTASVLLPLAFCRECGQEYLTVWRTDDGRRRVRYEPRRDTAATGADAGDGYLYIDRPTDPGRPTADEAIADRRLPDVLAGDRRAGGQERRREVLPGPAAAARSPSIRTAIECQGELQAAFIPAPFLFCLHCGVSYEQTRGKDFAKLATLDQEGRSLGDLADLRVHRALAATRAGGGARPGGPQAADLRRQPAGRLAPGRPLQRLRPGHPVARGAVPGGRATRARTGSPTRSCRPGHRGAGPRPGRLRRRARPSSAAWRADAAGRCGMWSPSGSTSTWSAAGASPCRTWSRRACCGSTTPTWTGSPASRSAGEDAHPAAARRRRRRACGDHAGAARRDAPRRSPSTCSTSATTSTRSSGASEERLIEPWVLAESDAPDGRHGLSRGARGRGRTARRLFLSGARQVRQVPAPASHFRDLARDETQRLIEQLLKVLTDAGLVTKVGGRAATPGTGARPGRRYRLPGVGREPDLAGRHGRDAGRTTR